MRAEGSTIAQLRQEALRSMRSGDWRSALRLVDQALSIEPQDVRSLVYRAQCLAALGRAMEARDCAAAALRTATPDAALFDAIGGVFSRTGDQSRALAAYDRAVALAPGNAHYIFNRAAVYRFLGKLREAETDYDRVIALAPTDYEAYINRSELRTQSVERNHIPELERLASQGIAAWQGEVQIRYALAKEYEDTGEYEKSFQQLSQGAAKRRAHLHYDVAVDVATVEWIREAFPKAPLEGPAAAADDAPRDARAEAPRDARAAPRDARGAAPGAAGAAGAADSPADAPIFIVGLPRSGTTLVDRILGSHSAVHSAGELNEFALCVVDAVRARAGDLAGSAMRSRAREQAGGAQLTRRELVFRSADIDFAALGRAYLARVPRVSGEQRRFTDKMPLNYLYCGLIRRALPNAKIVHLTREPMAVCYAMYKTLFKDGYPFSYDLAEIGRYYIAYRRLMDHWHASLPGGIYTVSYEALVLDQYGQTRRLLDFCGLEWQDACAEFHRSSAPATTASAVQVRRRIYDSSVSQWRHYAEQLEPLAAQLRAAGIDAQRQP